MEFMQSHTWLSTHTHTHTHTRARVRTHTHTHSTNLVVCNVFSSVQWLSCVQLLATPWTSPRQFPCPLATPGVYSNSCPWVLLMQYFTILKFNMKDLNQSHIVCVCLCVCVVTKSFWFFCNPMNCSPPGSSVHGISQAGILEWVSTYSSSHI